LRALLTFLFTFALSQGPSLPFGNVPQTAAPSNLVAYWKICGDTASSSSCTPSSSTSVRDSSGNANTGTWTGTQSGSTNWYSTGSVQTYAGAFDGTDNTISNSGFSQSVDQGGPLTIVGWANLSACGSNPQIWNMYAGSSPLRYASLAYSSNTCEPYAQIYSCTVTASTAVSTSTWHMLAETITGGTLTLYVDGVSAGAATGCTQTGSMSSLPFSIGSTQGSVQFLQGLLNNVSICNDAMTGAAIAALYASPGPCT
jgi:hypothetical protein